MRGRFTRLALLCALLAAGGCELVADFDRSRIPEGPTDDGGSDGGEPDSAVPPDGATLDAALDAGPDAGDDDGGAPDEDAG